MYSELKNKVVLVTGGSKGIGFGIASAFAKQGASLILVARDIVSLNAAKDALEKEFNVPVQVRAVNLSEEKNLSELSDFFPKVDVLVNSAGAMGRGSLFDIDPVQFRDAWEGKVMSTIFLTRHIYPFMAKNENGGVIINIIGMAAERLNFKSIGTSTANAALVAFNNAIGSESVNDNIRVVGISPGLIRTSRTEGILHPKNEVDRKAYEKVVSNLPFGRMGEPSEVADLAVFLASNSGKYISGEVINIDGGARYRY
ncbi:short-chain dehydrogenase/reductase [Polynucleobacter rarus]|uniref:short-chain dehydrogenase/reductase n=1 Tax=Polynucleobacter rarus TaxID=556055 RepID=UPI000D3E8134|nr:short-chain dehydrogenase/reductase [Polynucleobacter rarus]